MGVGEGAEGVGGWVEAQLADLAKAKHLEAVFVCFSLLFCRRPAGELAAVDL